MIKIISIEGGGVRGLIVVRFLQRLEEKLLQFYGKNIYQTFDFYSGTSVGAIVVGSIVYTKLDMNTIFNQLFSHQNIYNILKRKSLFSLFSPLSDGLQKTNLLKTYLGNILFEHPEKNVMFTSFNIKTNQSKIWKNWNDEDKKHFAYKLIDGSSSIPAYFPPVHIDNNTA